MRALHDDHDGERDVTTGALPEVRAVLQPNTPLNRHGSSAGLQGESCQIRREEDETGWGGEGDRINEESKETLSEHASSRKAVSSDTFLTHTVRPVHVGRSVRHLRTCMVHPVLPRRRCHIGGSWSLTSGRPKGHSKSSFAA